MHIKKILLAFARIIRFFVERFVELIMVPMLFLISFVIRFCKKKIDVGLGPEPLINYVYFKKSLISIGYTAETFVIDINYITNKYDKKFVLSGRLLKFFLSPFRRIYVFIWAIRRYSAIYTSFNGGPLGDTCGPSEFSLLKKLEPYFLKISNVKTLILPFGGDVYSYERSNSFDYRFLMRRDYGKILTCRQSIKTKKNIMRWTDHASGILCCGDEAYYIPCVGDYYLPSYLAIDLDEYNECGYVQKNESESIVVVHATNHPSLKGTEYFRKAIEELNSNGYNIEFVCLQNVPGETVKKELQRADIVAGQLILGIYGMFDVEAMAFGKPVLTYIDPNLISFWERMGYIDNGELPLGMTNVSNVKSQLAMLIDNRDLINEIGKKSRRYVEKHHSIEKIGDVFRTINENIGLSISNNTL